MDRIEYQNVLAEALNAYAHWLETAEFPKFKEEFRTFHASFGVLYKILLQKKLINEDPYKQEAKISEIKVPGPVFSEGDRRDQLTMNLSAYDNQLDFLVNFFQFSTDFLTMDNIKRILALVRYIDWAHFSSETQSSTTKVVVDMINQARLSIDPHSIKELNDSLGKLKQATSLVIGYLKTATAYNRELYKLTVRQKITNNMHEASIDGIRKKFAASMAGSAFYPDLIEELIKEDYSPGSGQLQAEILKRLAIPEDKPKTVKKQFDFKVTMLDGLLVISSVGTAIGDIIPRLDENHMLFQSRKQSFFEKLREIFRQMLNKPPEPVIYEIEYIDPVKGAAVKEKVNYNVFRTDLEKRMRSFSSFSIRNTSKLDSFDEKQLLNILERSVRDAQNLHKILTGLDDFFKSEAAIESKEKVKGIKPELGSIKNAIIKANQKRHEYSSKVEEEEQLRRLGVNPIT